MALQKAFLILLIFSIAGCLDTKTETQSSFSMTPQHELEVSGICRDMLLDGNVLSLLQTIKATTDHVLSLMKTDPVRQLDEISRLANKITLDSDKVKSLSRPEWSEPKYDHMLGWSIDNRDFKDLVAAHFDHFSLEGADLIHIYFMGQKRDDLKVNLQLDFDSSGIQIRFKNKTSAIDICQLERTLMIVIEVKTKSLLSKKSRYFNLIVNR